MAYGQGSGQANNVGSTYEALGFVGGRSFGLSLAATGYLCACVVGVYFRQIMMNMGNVSNARRERKATKKSLIHKDSRAFLVVRLQGLEPGTP